jgi:hypothetical protein
MSRPDWSKAPDWAKYLAMDADGGWWWFEARPTMKASIWELPKLTNFSFALATDHLPDFSETLESRP